MAQVETDEWYSVHEIQGKSEDNAKLGLSVSLAKNTKTFYRVRDGLWGLAEWYGITSRRKKAGNGDEAMEADDEGLDEAVKSEEFGEPEAADQEAVEAAKAAKG